VRGRRRKKCKHNLNERVQECGYRLTMPRKVIINELYNSDKHLSVDDIYYNIHKRHPNIGLTSVYRTLELLVELGIVYKFDFGDGRARFELVEGTKNMGHHHHLVCTECGKIIDYNDFVDEELELMKKTEKELERKYDFKIKNHILQFYGKCKKCKNK
jgi:Fur family ferric uptake transcriptional regulator